MPQPAGEEPDVAAANALMAAEPAPVAADTIGSVLLLGANGMLGPPVVNELGDHYSLSVTDINPYGWRGRDCELRGAAAPPQTRVRRQHDGYLQRDQVRGGERPLAIHQHRPALHRHGLHL